jgi:hypothetical protein
MLVGANAGDNRSVRRPGDGGNNADDTGGPFAVSNQLAEVRDFQAESVAVAKIAIVQTIDGNHHQWRRSGRYGQRG